MTDIYTIGFTKKSAEKFFSKLKINKVEILIDIRLNNVSQLAGFAKRDDLKYFLSELCNINYVHEPNLAPTKDILDAYKKKIINWNDYEKQFNDLLESRKAESYFNETELNRACFLCSEHNPDKCHRRLVVEYLEEKYDNINIRHL